MTPDNAALWTLIDSWTTARDPGDPRDPDTLASCAEQLIELAGPRAFGPSGTEAATRRPAGRCIEVPTPGWPAVGSASATSHAFSAWTPGTSCQCGQTVVGPDLRLAAAACPDCGGSGGHGEEPCNTCGGNYYGRQPDSFPSPGLSPGTLYIPTELAQDRGYTLADIERMRSDISAAGVSPPEIVVGQPLAPLCRYCGWRGSWHPRGCPNRPATVPGEPLPVSPMCRVRDHWSHLTCAETEDAETCGCPCHPRRADTDTPHLFVRPGDVWDAEMAATLAAAGFTQSTGDIGDGFNPPGWVREFTSDHAPTLTVVANPATGVVQNLEINGIPVPMISLALPRPESETS